MERGKDIGGWKWKELWQFRPSRSSQREPRCFQPFERFPSQTLTLKQRFRQCHQASISSRINLIASKNRRVRRATFELFILRERTEKFVMASISPTTRGLKQFGGSFGTEKRNRGKTCQAERERGSRADYVFRIANMRDDGLKAACLKVD